MSDQPFVFVVDDDTAVLRAVTTVGKSAGFPVRVFESAEDFLYAYEGQRGCLVLDIRMPMMSGLELLAMLRQAEVRLPVIMISGHANIRMAVDAMRSGAFTFLEKPFRMHELAEALQQAIELDRQHSTAARGREQAAGKLATLTEREREVLELVLQGQSNKEIADRLNLSIRAIEDRRSRIMKRLEAGSLIELVQIVHLARL